MQKYTDLVLGLNGQTLVPVVGASVTVLTYPGGAAATIYSDNGITQTANPLTTDATGRFSFYAPNGRYSLRVTYQSVSYSVQDFPLLDDPANGQTVVITGGSIDNTPIGATTPSTGAFTTLSANGAVSGAGFTAFMASPSPIGSTTPNTGGFTTVTLTPQTTPALVNGITWSGSGQFCLQTYAGGLQTYVPGVVFAQTNTVTTSGTSASTWLGTGIGTLTIPANYLVAGKTIVLRAYGAMTTAATPGTITYNFALGSSSLWTSSALTPTASLTSVPFTAEIVVTCRTTGSSGSCAIYGLVQYFNNSTGAILGFGGTVNGSATLNTTVSNAITLTTTNSIAAGCVFTVLGVTVEAKA